MIENTTKNDKGRCTPQLNRESIMRNNLKKIIRTGTAIAVFAGLTAGSAIPAHADDIGDALNQFGNCFGLALSNPEEHKEKCLGNRNPANINEGVGNKTPPQMMIYTSKTDA